MMEERLTMEELERLPYLRTAIDNGVEKMLELEMRKTSIRSGLPSGIRTGNEKKGLDDLLAVILDQQEELRNSLQEFQEEWYNISVKISQIKNLRIRLIIEYRFESNLPWQQVADKLGGERDTEDSVRIAFNRWMKRQDALSQKM